MSHKKLKGEILDQVFKNLKSTAKEARKKGDLEAQLASSALLMELHSRITDLKGESVPIGFTDFLDKDGEE